MQSQVMCDLGLGYGAGQMHLALSLQEHVRQRVMAEKQKYAGAN